jgi:tetratricopeptide (TPR) repeat protein
MNPMMAHAGSGTQETLEPGPQPAAPALRRRSENTSPPALAALWFLAPLLLMLAFSAREITDSDTWWHLKTGEIIASEHRIPRADPFSAANAGKDWVNFEWLAQLCFYEVYRTWGPQGLVLGAMLLTVLTFLSFSLAGLQLRRPWLGSALLALSVVAASERYRVRPELFSCLFLGLFLLVLHRYRQGLCSRLIFILPLLQVLWENLHGGTWLGIESVGAYAVGQTLLRHLPFPAEWKKPELDPAPYRRLLVVLLLVILASLLNPWGAETLFTIFKTQSHQWTMAHIAEWQRTLSIRRPLPAPVLAYWVWVALAGLGFAINFRRLDLNQLFLMLGFCFMSLLARRNLALFALVALPITARNLAAAGEMISARLGKNSIPRPRALVAARVAAMVGLTLGCLWLVREIVTDRYYLRQHSRLRFGLGVSSVVYPWPMLDFLAQSPLSGPIFNNHDLGGFLIWRLWPRYQVFLDSRAVIYDPDYLSAYSEAMHSPAAWQAFSARHHFQAVALLHQSKDVTNFLPILDRDPDWVPVYLDESGVVFARNLPQSSDWIARHRLDLTQSKSLVFSSPAHAQRRTRLGFFSAAADPVPEEDAAQFYLNLGILNLAEPLLRQALAIDPDDEAAASNLAGLLCQEKRWLEAEDWARQAIRQAREDAAPYLHLANALYNQERWAESLAAVSEAVRLDPGDPTPLYNRGLALTRLGRLAEAAADLEKARALDPEEPQTCRKLVRVYELLHDRRAEDIRKRCSSLSDVSGAPAEADSVQ